MVDGEEYIFQEKDPYFLGAEHFARDYAKEPATLSLSLRGAVGHGGQHSPATLQGAEQRDLGRHAAAGRRDLGDRKRLGVKEFVAEKKYEVLDDHLALHDIGHIPTCDVIDFDYASDRVHYSYPPWHTRADTPQQCSALSLAKVGWVLRVADDGGEEVTVEVGPAVPAGTLQDGRHSRPYGLRHVGRHSRPYGGVDAGVTK